MSWEDYWQGALWVYHADITNDGSNSGNHVYSVSQAVGSEMEVIGGRVLNGDASSRTLDVYIDDGTNQIMPLITTKALGAGDEIPLLSRGGSDITPFFNRVLLSGTMRLIVNIAALAVNKDTAVGIICRIRYPPLPTVTLTSPTNAVETVNTNLVF